MRIHLAAAIVVTILAAFTAKLLFFGTPPVVADTGSGTINIQQMQIEQGSMDKLPVQEVKEPF
jgi:hypothetical protein